MKDNLTILLAEDDLDDQELILHAFSKVGPSFRLRIVNDGKEALDVLSDTPDSKLPCLIVLDYNMPQLNGAQVLEKLKTESRYNTIPKVILSTSTNPTYIQDCLKKGADAYRVKPDNFNQLVLLAKEMMDLCTNAA
jgi:CheY-like chemotaxis protein